MATRLYGGLLVSVVTQGVLINSGGNWSVHPMELFLEGATEILEKTTGDNIFIQWYDYWGDDED